MPIDFSSLRWQQIFPWLQQQRQQEPTVQQPEYDSQSRMRELYQPEMQMQNRFNESIDQMPTREQYQPSRMRQIGAALASLGSIRSNGNGNIDFGIPEGMAIQREMLEGPYNRARSDWEGRLKPIQQAADNERLSNTNNRMFANDMVRSEMSDRTLNRQITRDEQLKREGDERIRASEARTEVARKLANIKEYQQNNPTMVKVEDYNGNVYFVDPTNPSRKIPTGIDTKQLTEMEKINLDLKNEKDLIAARGAAATATKQAIPGKNLTPVPRPAVPPTKTTTRVLDDQGNLHHTTETTRGPVDATTEQNTPPITREDGKVLYTSPDGTSNYWIFPKDEARAVRDGLKKATK